MAYLLRLVFCSTAAVDYIRSIQVHKVTGWSSEEWFESVESRQPVSIPSAMRYFCFYGFDTTVDFSKVVGLFTGALRTMQLHSPQLQWSMGAFRLEGSVQHSKVTEHPDFALTFGRMKLNDST